MTRRIELLKQLPQEYLESVGRPAVEMSEEQVVKFLRGYAWQVIGKHYTAYMQIARKAANYDENIAEELMSDTVYERMPYIISNWIEKGQKGDLFNYSLSMLYWYCKKAMNRRRKRRRQEEYSLSNFDNTDAHEIKCEPDSPLMVESMLEFLNEEDATIVRYIAIENRTGAETADLIGRSTGFVSARYRKALRRLKDEYVDNE